ncbi:MAG: hypothetical protein Q8W51_01515 [Candidatus Palauibacterales bacterium]|nr:hypothetical protein [Candidatus Palauibacterales bacterium]MDP2528398.1 hypothetical protein [Candidatus Palauibacterales bacterium]MDP2584984.1 hypothetical protein [Candidatus Palauibacterales bacterium]
MRAPSARCGALVPALVLLLGLSRPALGQMTPTPRNGPDWYYDHGFLPVEVAVVDSLPYGGAPAVVMRRTDRAPAEPHDYLLMARSHASAKLLRDTLFDLFFLQSRYGTCPKRARVMRVNGTSHVPPPRWNATSDSGVAETLRELRAKKVEEIPDVGRGREIEMWIRRYYTFPVEQPPRGGPVHRVC